MHHKNYSLENIEGEIWLSVVGYEGRYEVSNMGRIKILKRASYRREGKEKIANQYLNEFGYPMVRLSNGEKAKTLRVHRLVGISFIPNPENKTDINHKKGIKTDARVSELEWNTRSENHLHAFRTGLKVGSWLGVKGSSFHLSKQVSRYTIEGKYIDTFENAVMAEEKTGVGSKHISSVCTGNRPTAGGYVWRHGNAVETPPIVIKKGINNPCCKLVLDTQTGIYYLSSKEAAEAKNIGTSALSSMLTGKYKNKTSLIYV